MSMSMWLFLLISADYIPVIVDTCRITMLLDPLSMDC